MDEFQSAPFDLAERTGSSPIANQDGELPTVQQDTVSSSESDPDAIDPRYYFRETLFQAEAEKIDRNQSHPWEASRGEGLLVRDEYGSVAMTETFDPEDPDVENRSGLLLAELDGTNASSSAYIRNKLDSRTRGSIADVVIDVSPRLKGKTHHVFIRMLIKLLPALENQPDAVVVDTITTMILQLLPDHPQAIGATEIPQIGMASLQQQEQLSRLILLASKKMPAETFALKLAELQDNLRRIDDPFGINYPSMIIDIRKWVLYSREDTSRNYDAVERKEPLTFSVKDRATRTFSSAADLELVLKALPFRRKPSTSFAHSGRKRAEVVQLERVLGGTNMDDWTVSSRTERSVAKIFELTQDLIEGPASVAGRNLPIRAFEIDGNYYIDEDGRHRTAALKALGVPEVPMLVTHVSYA